MQTNEQERLRTLQEIIEEQNKKISEQDKKISEQEARIKAQNIQIENLIQALLHAQKKIFGASSEAKKPETEQVTPFPEAEKLIEELAKEQKKITVPGYTRTARKPGVREEMLSGIPVEIVRCEIAPEELCDICGSELKRIGSRIVRSEVVYQPATVKVVQYIQEVYKCTVCGTKNSENPTDVFRKAAVPAPLLVHSLASASCVAQIMYQKYMMGIPLNRQEDWWYQLGFVLSRSTMANWVIRCCEEWFNPIYNRIHEELKRCEILQMDESRIQCNKEEGKKASSESFMWVMRSGAEEELQAVLFYYSRSRSGENARKLLEGFHSYLVTDAYAGYEKAEDIIRALCWSHVRRYFIRSIPLDNNGAEIPGSKGAEGREYCNLLFKVEDEISGLPPEERKMKRQAASRAILDAFWAWVDKTSSMFTTNEKLTEALGYCKNQKPYLETFLEDGRIPISNNLCENAIRPFAVGRRAWLFADTPKGAQASAVAYSITETAKANKLNVFNYFQFLLEKMPNTDFRNHPEQIEEFLPWSKTLPTECRMVEKGKKAPLANL